MKTRHNLANSNKPADSAVSADNCENEAPVGYPPNAPRKTTRDAGSTIVGVLAALVFIGIVVASMLKNTGSQATVSGSYAKVSAAQLSVRNGFVATEGFFLNTANGVNRTNILDSAMRYPNSGAKQFFVYPLNVVGNGSHSSKTEIASSGRKISSRIKSFNHTTKIAEFEVKSEKNFRTGRAFYYVDVDIIYPPPGTNPFSNAVRMNGPLADGNNSFNVPNGPVTILGDVKLQNKNASFGDEVYIGGNLDIPGGSKSVFNGPVYVKGTTTIQDAATFNGDAWFENAVTVANKEIEFKKGFVAEKNVDINNYSQSGKQLFGGNTIINGSLLQVSQNNDLTIGGDVYIGGNIPQGANRIKLPSNKQFNYSDVLTNVPSTTNVASQNLIPADQNPASTTNTTGSVGNVNRCDIKKVLPKEDPQLDITKIPPNLIYNARASVSKFAENGGAASDFSIKALNDLWTSVKDDQSKLYNGHLVVKMTESMTFSAGVPFEGKVIFIVENGTLNGGNGNFFSNKDENSSTMLYVGPTKNGNNPNVNNFGTSGTFNGLVYIDKENTYPSNDFKWHDNAVVNGAIHNLSSKPLVWNTGSGNSATTINFDGNILGQYSSLIDCSKAPVCQPGQTASGGPNATCKSNGTAPSCVPCPTSGATGTPSTSVGSRTDQRISLRPLGFYNY